MNDGCWFNLPDGSTATQLDVTIPVKGRVLCPASIMQEVDAWRDDLHQQMERQRWHLHGSLREMMASVIGHHERTAADAFSGAEQVRQDMLVYLRSAVFVLESVVGEHLTHYQKNERIRGAISVLERHVAALREEKLDFTDAMWRRAPDLFRFNGPEQRLRERIAELEGQVVELSSQEPDHEHR